MSNGSDTASWLPFRDFMVGGDALRDSLLSGYSMTCVPQVTQAIWNKAGLWLSPCKPPVRRLVYLVGDVASRTHATELQRLNGSR
jgi:hypothetical protein